MRIVRIGFTLLATAFAAAIVHHWENSMKSLVSVFGSGILIALLCASSAVGQGQIPAGNNVSGGSGAIGNSSLAADIPSYFPGRYWFELNGVDNGLGYDGSFVTFGGKKRLFQDFLDGRWLGEAQGSVSLQNGGLIGNIGIERVFSVHSAPADVSFGLFYDRDDSGVGNFTNPLDQVGVSGAIKTPKWDVRANGYFPIGTSQYSQGDPSGNDCFLGHNIVLQPGIDSGLQGFDTEIRLRPYWLTMLNGTLDLGGYYYDSDLVESFGGARVRLGLQGLLGTIWSLEVDHDDRFETTAIAQVGWQFGNHGGHGGHEYSQIGRDMEKTVRSLHVARFNQDLILAVNPATGSAYEVFHVDNTAIGGDGTFERRFDTLAKAEAASGPNDIIFVFEGDGSTSGMNDGITLQDGQFLLGDGVAHNIPIQGGRTFRLCNDIDGQLPTITNSSGEAITMANNNVVRGFNINGNGGMVQAIRATGVDNGEIDTVNISGGTQFDGILLDAVTGDWTLTNNTVRDSGRDGLHIENVTDTAFRLFVNQGSYSNNNRDGINISNFDGRLFRFTGVRTDNNIRHGVFMTDFLDAGIDSDFQFLQPIALNNGGDGIFLQRLDGNVLFQNVNIQNNSANGIHLVDVTNSDGGTFTTINAANGDIGQILNNGIGAGAGINVQLTAGTQRLRIGGQRINDNGFGILVRAENLGTILDTQVVDNFAINNNESDGGRFISVGGAAHTVLVENTNNRLGMLNNGSVTGNGLSFLSGDGALDTSSLDVIVRNVNLTDSGSGLGDAAIFGNVDRNGQLTLRSENNILNTSAGDGMRFVFDANNGVLNSVNAIGNTINGSGDQGIQVTSSGTSLVDFIVSPATITNSVNDGISLAGSDTSFTRLLVAGSTITGNGVGTAGNGINTTFADDSRGFVEVTSSTVTGNGGLGLNMIADGTSILSTRIDNSLFNGNDADILGALDANLDTLGTGVINALLTGNTFGSFDGENAVTGRMCLALSTNSFAGAALLTNNAAPADYTVELDGTSNGAGQPTFAPNEAAFTRPPFGSTCETAVDDQEFIFESFGFPAR